MADSRFSAGRGQGAGSRRRSFGSRARDDRYGGRGDMSKEEGQGKAASVNVHGSKGRRAMRGGRGPGSHGVIRSGWEGQRAGKTKQKWRPSEQQKQFVGSANEGHGFALWRKQKVQLNYKKLLRKESKSNVSTDVSYADHYPEHLKHLYLAEEEKLRNEELKKRRNPEDQTTEEDTDETPLQSDSEQPLDFPEGTISATSLRVKQTNCSEKQSTERSLQSNSEQSQKIPEGSTLRTPLSVEEDTNRAEGQPNKRQKIISRKTSYQKARQEYERVQLERAKKRQEAENDRKKREEAKKLYKKKKMEAYKILSKKTKKGQPNFNAQMEYLLKKIQDKS